MSESPSFDITTCNCDVCGRRSVCALHIVKGRPVHASCAVCDRPAWEALGASVQETWLAGGTPRFGRPRP